MERGGVDKLDCIFLLGKFAQCYKFVCGQIIETESAPEMHYSQLRLPQKLLYRRISSSMSMLVVTSLCVVKFFRRKLRQKCIILSCVFHRIFYLIAALMGQYCSMSILVVTSLCVAKLLRRKVRQRCIILSCVFHGNFYLNAALKGQ